MLDMRWIWATRYYTLHGLATITYPTRAREIIVNWHAIVTFLRDGDIGGPNTAIPQEKLKYRVKTEQTPITHLDPFIIGHAYFKLPPSFMFSYLKHVCINYVKDLSMFTYSLFIAYLLAFIAYCVSFHGLYETGERKWTELQYREESSFTEYRQPKNWKPNTAGLHDTDTARYKFNYGWSFLIKPHSNATLFQIKTII